MNRKMTIIPKSGYRIEDGFIMVDFPEAFFEYDRGEGIMQIQADESILIIWPC